MENLTEDIQEQLARQDEIAQAFTQHLENDKDELEDELEKMMADAEAEELDNLNIPASGIITNNNNKVPVKPAAQQIEATEEEEDELNKMMML